MKKTLLLAIGLALFIASIGQQSPAPKTELQIHKATWLNQTIQNGVSNSHHEKQINPDQNENQDFVTIINIGTSANAYGYAVGQNAFVCVNQDLNTVTNFHRMGGALDPGGFSGDLGYDISTDGGMTWTTMIEVYKADDSAGGGYYTDAARFPNHGIYNPLGNTDPNEAYVAWVATTSGAAPGDLSAYIHGRANIGNPEDTTSNYVYADTTQGIYPGEIEGYTLTNLGEFWAIAPNFDWFGGGIAYQNELILNRGIWNEELEDFEVTQSLLACPMPDSQRPGSIRVEFAPDGQTGYIAVLCDNGSVPFSQGRSYYPILFKTTDAGDTWTGPIPVAIAGPGGIEEIQNFLSDAELAEIYGTPIPDPDTIEFTTAYDFDLSVDAWGNPQIAVICGITGEDPYSIITARSEVTGYQFTAAFLISSFDGGENFFAYELGRQKTFRGYFGDLTTDNRIQIARTYEGTLMFVSWLDTQLPGVTENQQPDIFARGVNLVTHEMTEVNGFATPTNVTEFSEGMWQAYFFTMGNEVFTDPEYMEKWTIPYVYQEMNPEEPGEEVQYKYVQDFYYTIYDFPVYGIDEYNDPEIIVSQNFPNPASKITTINFWLEEPATLGLEITNLIGQSVFEIPGKKYEQGMNSISLNVSAFPAGVYFYSVGSGETRICKRMIVK